MSAQLLSFLNLCFEQERERMKEMFETVKPEFVEIGSQKQTPEEVVLFCETFATDLASACLFEKLMDGECVVLESESWLKVYYYTACETVLLECCKIFNESDDDADAE